MANVFIQQIPVPDHEASDAGIGTLPVEVDNMSPVIPQVRVYLTSLL